MEGGVPTINDIIVSDGATIHEDHIRIGERFVRSYFVVQYPNEVYVTWLEDVFKMGDIDVTFHIYPGENHAVIKELTTGSPSTNLSS